MDTAKVANLFSCYPEAELLDFVNAPVGKGLPIDKKLKTLVAIPTTAGTGSETTGTAIFDYTPLKAKTGIANRALRPTLGIVDPLNTVSKVWRVGHYSSESWQDTGIGQAFGCTLRRDTGTPGSLLYPPLVLHILHR